MKKTYIKPTLDCITLANEGRVMATASAANTEIYQGSDSGAVGTEGNTFARPNNPSLWENEW